jgi:hypothetical protein
MIDMNDPNWGEKFSEWLSSPEGQASLDGWRDELVREDRAKERFANRIKSMSVEKQDEWMQKIIARYNSDEYIDRWYKRGIFPPNWLFERIREFIFDNGVEVGETEDGSPIYQYNHWKMNCLYGQGECHHEFSFTKEAPHRYGDGIFYIIRHWNRKVHTMDNIISKSWEDAKFIIDGFVEACKKEGIVGLTSDDFEIIEVMITDPKEMVKSLESLVKYLPPIVPTV